MMQQVRRWLPQRLLVLVVDGGFAAVALALACTASEVVMVSRLRLDAALYHPPEPRPANAPGRKPTKGPRQRSLKVWAARTDTPWESAVVDWYHGRQNATGLLPYGAVVHLGLGPGGDSLCLGGDVKDGWRMRPSSVLTSRLPRSRSSSGW